MLWVDIPERSGCAAFTDPDAKPANQARMLAEFHGLTNAEAGIALQLASGANLKAIGEELGISYETVRNHMKAIFAKTGAHRQAEVVALCNKIAGV